MGIFRREKKGTQHMVTYPAQLMGTLHTAHLDVSILSARDDLYTLKVAGQDDYVTAGSIGLQKAYKTHLRAMHIASMRQHSCVM